MIQKITKRKPHLGVHFVPNLDIREISTQINTDIIKEKNNDIKNFNNANKNKINCN